MKEKFNTYDPFNMIRTNKYQRVLSFMLIVTLVFMPFLSLVLCNIFKIADNETPIKALMKITIALIACFAFVEAYQKRLTANKMIIFIIAAGVIIRIGYMMYTPWAKRVYDVGGLDANGVGHGSYIINNILQGHLPHTNEYQFYHPPFYYFISALAIKIASIFKHTSNYASLIKYAAAVSCAASCVTLAAIQNLMDAVKIKRKYQVPAMAIAALFPNFILMGGRVNNDAFMTLFMVLAVYSTVRWFYSTSVRDIIFIALSIGFGMMSKVSCGVVALFTGPVMLYKLYISVKNKKSMPFIKQLIIFALICFPLALWYPVRNYINFSQPLNYVCDLGSNSHVYTGNIPAVKRFFSAPLYELFKQPFMNPDDDYSIFMIITRTAVFGEFQYEGVSKIVSIGLYYINLITIAASLAAMVIVCVKDKRRDWFSRYAMAAVWVITFISFLIFNISYPYSCTADTRYIPLAVIGGIIYMSAACELYEKSSSAAVKRIFLSWRWLVAAYCIMVMIMYI